MFSWLSVRAVAQALTVILVARLLGVEAYGQFVAALAVAGIFVPLASLGLPGMLLREGARAQEKLPWMIGASLALWRRGAAAFGLLAAIAAVWMLPASASASALTAFAILEVASNSLAELVARVQQAQHRAHRYGAIMAGLVLFRLVATAGYVVFLPLSVDGWLWICAVTSGMYIFGLSVLLRQESTGVADERGGWKFVRAGVPFAVSALSVRIQAEFNKPALAHLGYSLAGNFGVAQRVVDLASLPLAALQEALWSRLYASTEPLRRIRNTGAVIVALALVGGVTLYLAAPLLPLVLGQGYEATAQLIESLAWLPAMQAVRNLLRTYAHAILRGDATVIANIAGGVVAIVLVMFMVPLIGLGGGVIALYSSEAVMVLILMPLLFSQSFCTWSRLQ